MRIQGIWKIIKNKHEMWIIAILICCSLSLLNSMSYLTKFTQNILVVDRLDDYGADLHISISSGEDPSILFEHYLEDYPSPLEFEAEFRSTIIGLKNVISSLNYLSENFNKSEMWEYPTTNIDSFIVGIDELTFNYMQNKTNGNIINLNQTYQDLEHGLVVSNFLGAYDFIISELLLAIYTDAESSLQQSKPLYMDFRNTQLNKTEISPNTWISKNGSQLPLISRFEITNSKKFYSLVGIDLDSSKTPIFLCGEKFLQHFQILEGEGINQYQQKKLINLKINREYLLSESPLKIKRQIDSLRAPLTARNKDSEYSELFIEEKDSVSNIHRMVTNTQNAQFYTLLIYIPIFSLCGIFLTVILNNMIERRKEEYRLYLINGMEIRTLRLILLGIGFCLGFIGGMSSSFGGIVLSNLLINILYPDISETLIMKSVDLWTTFFQNCGIFAILGGFFVICFFWKPLKMFNQEFLVNNEAKRKEVRSPLWRKIEFSLFIIFIAFSIFAIALRFASIPMDIDLIQDTEYPFIIYILEWFGPIMGVLPFAFPLLLINLIGDKAAKWITIQKKQLSSHSSKIISFEQSRNSASKYDHPLNDEYKQKKNKAKSSSSEKIRSSMNNRSSILKKLTIWKLSKNLTKNKKLLKLFTFTLILITISSNLVNSYQYSEKIHSSLYNAEGEILKMTIFENLSISNINNEFQNFQSESYQINRDHFNAIYHTQTNEDRFSDEDVEWDVKFTSIEVANLWNYRFSWVNYSNLLQNTIILDDWFIGGKVDDIFSRMDLPNSILIPDYFLSRGVKINDTLVFSVKMVNGTTLSQEGVIIGAYSNFPAALLEGYSYNWENQEKLFEMIYMSYDLLKGACVKSVQFISYSQKHLADSYLQDLNSFVSLHLDSDIFIEQVDLSYYYNDFDIQIFHLFQLEGYLFIGFAIFGFLIFNFVDNIQSGREIAILRSKGMQEKNLLKSALWEITLLSGCASVLSLLGMICIGPLIMFLNFYRSGSSKAMFPLIGQLDWYFFLGILLIGNFFFLIINAGFAILKLKSTRSDHKLEIFLRSARQ
ncbi:FtsX-like permease family protein [Candidatus Lokiarchaeum ossiferum]|uniref:FtsX-like permease family protein n=1 Tax=Candidatus Lokiarchaeum ossiferum TaxID=2951803 RepID=UPI00352D7FD3